MFNILAKITKYSDIALACGVVGILMVLLLPIPTGILDFLLAVSIAIAVIILMNTLFIKQPLELSVFPTLLLVTTLLRLSLNIASTRLILARGHTGTSAAGHVIEAFGHFVMQGNVVIGLIVFLILTIINFIVITKGSGRIAEVAARFSLDAMPGKQMAIDADLSAGIIDETAAKERRKNLEDESTFYGAMDGANKFVRGDAIAGLIITFINLIGGIIIGVVQRNLSFDTAIGTYAILTIGDGLVTQIPALVISLASGLLITKSGVAGSADKAIFGQLSKYPQSMWMTSVVTLMLAFTPGLPTIPFLILSLTSVGVGYLIYYIKKEEESDNKKTSDLKKDTNTQDAEPIMGSLSFDLINLDLGFNLLTLVSNDNSPLTEQIKSLRMQIAKDFGFVIPSIRIQDNIQLENNSYLIKIKELDAGKGRIMANKLMIMNPFGQDIDIPGEDTTEPAFGLPAKWVEPDYKEEALFKNYTVVNPATVITTHLIELIKENITELLSYGETQKLLDEIDESNKKLVKDIIPDVVSVATVQKVLQNLLAESISIRDLPQILEAISDAAANTKNITLITETVRKSLSRQISYANTIKEGFIPVVIISNELEKTFMQSLIGEGENKQISMPPSQLQDFVSKVNQVYDEQSAKNYSPVLLTNSIIRPYVRSIIERFKPHVVVMSQSEVHYKAKIRTLANI